MNGRQRDDAVHEYLEAKLHQRLDRRDFLRLSSGLVIASSAAAFLAACGASSTAATPAPTAAPTTAPTSAPTAAPTPVPTANIKGTTLQWIGLDGEDGAKVDSAKKWRDDHGVTLASKYIGTGDEIFAALAAGQQFDIAITFNPYIVRSAQAKLIQPLDTSRLSNWPDMFDGLRNAAFLNVDGKPYGAPIAWGDGPVVFNPKKVPQGTEPTSIVDLYDKKWAKRLTMSNDPAWLFHLTAISLGLTKSPYLTKAELKQVADKSATFVKQNVVSFAATYADATDLLVRGEVDLSLLGWEAMLNFAKDKGGELAFGFLKEGKGGWSDSYCIPASIVNTDAAYAYIDAIISPQINADVAVNLVSGTVNKKGVALIAAKDNIYDYKNVESAQDGVFDNYLAPETVTDPNNATRADWTDAWGKITA